MENAWQDKMKWLNCNEVLFKRAKGNLILPYTQST